MVFSALPSATVADGWDGFVTWVSGDPGDVVTLLGVGLTFIVAAVSAWISWRAYRATKVHGERDLGMGRYRVAIEFMNEVPPNPGRAVEGVRILKFLLRSDWPTRLDREMAEEALKEYQKRLAGGAE